MQDFLNIGRVSRLAKQAAAEIHRRPYGFKCVRRQFLRYKTDQGARRAVTCFIVMTINDNGAARFVGYSADHIDQSCFSRTIGAQKGEYFALSYFQIDIVQGHETIIIDF